MPDLIGKDTEAVLEKHVGKTGTRVLVVLGAVAFAVLCLAIMVNAVRSTFTALRPIVPNAWPSLWTDWLFRGAVVAVSLIVGWALLRRFRSVESNAAIGLDLVAQDLMERILDKKPVGQHPIAPKQAPVTPLIQGTTEANLRVELAKKVLREAAAVARETGTEKIDYDPHATAQRAALHYVLLRMVRDLFSHHVIADFDAQRKTTEQKREMRNQSPDGRSHFIEIADFFERLAEKIEIDDLDPAAECPGSFAQYRNHGPWSGD